MKQPLIIVNFKTYPNGTGVKGLELAKIHEKVARESGATIVIAVQAVDLRMMVSEVDLPVLAQHFDLSEQGPFTGHVTPHSLREIGAFGSILNHSEKRLSLDHLEESLELARDLGLYTIVCSDTPYTGKAVSELNPDLVAIEPPELIGGDISVSQAEPQLIQDAVAMIGKGKVIVGAGVKTADDVRLALEYGASGVLVSSGVARSMDPEKALRELIFGLLKR
ncbi:MAG TPA: triose-phosphate isomerase [Candidatus Gracilibacteria bacterium]|nr:triose-phosphate isomerase [Candidatus Gracilibacteria bacterium]